MPCTEMAIWNAHFTKRPPDSVERLLAHIVVILMNSNRKEGSQPVKIYDVAPWLEPVKERKEREFREQDIYLQNTLAAVLGED